MIVKLLYYRYSSFPPNLSTTPGNRIRIKVKNRGGYAVGEKMGIIINFDQGITLNNADDINNQPSLTGPGDSRNSLTVGAIPENNYNVTNLIGDFSEHGSVRTATDATGRVITPECMKPEIVAPGNATSAAAPHVAGAAALIAQLKPELLQNAQAFKNYILSSHTIRVHTASDNIYGYGKLYLDSSIIPTSAPIDPDDKNVLVYPNPISSSEHSYLKITTFSLDISKLEPKIYNINGEFVKSFSILEFMDDINKKTLRWDLRNENGNKVAPGVYFISIKTDSGKTQIKKFAIQK
ncbi:MAG: S8 family serine peptidase [Endomicrobium sp.]|jgi:hypothetical protein|nr:S8 family serine peptidase [Endomicrobium sp.]